MNFHGAETAWGEVRLYFGPDEPVNRQWRNLSWSSLSGNCELRGYFEA